MKKVKEKGDISAIGEMDEKAIYIVLGSIMFLVLPISVLLH
jgi:hypothetical protein